MAKFQGSLISYFSGLAKQHGGINLAQGIPGFQPPKGLLSLVSQVVGEQHHQYPPAKGNFNLIRQLVLYYSSRKQVTLDESNLIILQGATEAIYLVFFLLMKQFSRQEWSVATVDPPYESYSKLPAMYGKLVHFLPIHQGEIDLTLLKELIEKHHVRLLYLASPGNPWGIMIKKVWIEQIVQLCQERQCHVFFDAVYEELYFYEKPYVPYKLLNPYLWIAGSFSKIFSITGWRLGYLIYDNTWDNELNALHDYVGLCANAPFQEALARFILSDEALTYMQWLRDTLRLHHEIVQQSLAFGGCEVMPANGGYFAWAKIPQHFEDGWAFASKLFDQYKVAVVPGEHFSANAKSFIRINIARRRHELETGLAMIQSLLQKRF